MSYNPSVKLYYLPQDNNASTSDSYRLVPAPQINITPEIYYANNIAIGYTYNVTLEGYATSLDLRNPSPSSSFNETLSSIQNIKNLFFITNGTLLITNDGKDVIKGTGGILKSMEFQESDNNWVNYAPYTIQIEFNELLLGSCSGAITPFNCINLPSGIVSSPELVDMTKYKIKSFEDNWSINLDENIYNAYSGINNNYFSVEYTINAVGKNYINYINNNLLPSWEQAKNFVQDRLGKQIKNLTLSCLDSKSDDGCSNGVPLSSVFAAGDGILSNINLNNGYDIFNENITIQASESDGSFSATYKALIKEDGENNNAIHTFNVTKKISDNDSGKIISYNAQGTIQGLVIGGLIKGSGVLSLPSSGIILQNTESRGNSKYSRALDYYDTIGDSKNLKDNFISQKLQINYLGLGISGCGNPSGVPPCTSFSLTHDYTQGIISYNIEYDSLNVLSRMSGVPIKTYSLSIEEPVPMIAEFIVPGRSGGPIFQLLDIETPRKYFLSVDGLEKPAICNTFDIESLVSSGCDNRFDISTSGIPVLNFSGCFLAEEKYKKGFNGTYTLTRTYIEASGA
jgi:hypothetical protein